ncbi:MAG: hypothetical protein KDA78_16535 [Planctomycetaceae bacterium]|nr:hypothetical protein [Planctomycetaceae bacterium]
MKLNLRYLLAYLDDVLKPSDSAAVGRLIKSTPRASELVRRIQSIIRMRRLSAPDPLDSSGNADPNDVAEYLDNLTPATEMERYESFLLKSDEHLAEVAATHQILSQYLGDKPSISDSTREKMHEIAMAFLPENSEWEEDLAKSGSAIDIPAMVAPQESASAPELVIPFEHPPRGDGWKQFLVILGIVLVLGVWAYSILTDHSFRYASEGYVERRFDRSEVDGNQPEVASNQNLPDSNLPAATTSDSPAVKPDNTIAAVDPTVPQTAAPPMTTSTAVAPPATTSEVMPVDPNGNPAVAVAPAPPAPPRVFMPVTYQTENLPLVYARNTELGINALLAAPQMPLELGDQLYVPQYSLAAFGVGEGCARMQLRSNTAVLLPGSVADQVFALEIQRGGVLFETLPDAPLKLKALEIHVENRHFEFLLPETPVKIAISVQPRLPQSFETMPNGQLEDAIIWVEGEVILKNHDGNETKVSGGHFMFPPSPAEVAEEQNPAEANQPPAVPMPTWMNGEPETMTLSQRRDQQEFLKLLEDSSNLWLDLQGVANDPNPRIAALATRLLALGQQYQTLVSILARSPHEESRTEAILGLRTWLPIHEEHRTELIEAMEKMFNPETAQTIYPMLWGYSHDDGKRPDISRRLVDSLQHEHVAVRELAIYWIEQLTGQRLGYRPLAVASTREQAIAAWEKHLNRVGALVDPKE